MTNKKQDKAKAADIPRAATNDSPVPKPTHAQIAERAYYLFETRGGSDWENWLQAEQDLRAAASGAVNSLLPR